MKFFVYKITNLINNKIYIGKAKNIKVRWSAHKTAAKKKRSKDYGYFHRALNKYGFENFKIEEIAEYESEKEAFEAETYYIKLYDSNNRNIGYNLTNGGDGPSGLKFSDSAKQKMSEAKKGKFIGKNNPFYGKKHSEETLKSQSEIMKKIHNSKIKLFNELNLKQCSLNNEQALEIQRKYLTCQFSMEQLANDYFVSIKIIHSILHGNYLPIKNCSLITEEMFNIIKKIRKIEQSRKQLKKYSTKLHE